MHPPRFHICGPVLPVEVLEASSHCNDSRWSLAAPIQRSRRPERNPTPGSVPTAKLAPFSPPPTRQTTATACCRVPGTAGCVVGLQKPLNSERMTKQQLIEKVAAKTELKKSEVEVAVDSVLDMIAEALQANERVDQIGRAHV